MVGIIAMVIVFALREIAHYLQDERKDKLISELTDKIQAKDYTEYVEAKAVTPIFDPVDKNDNDLYWQEIEESKQ